MTPPADPPRVHPSALPASALMAECDLRFTRRSGPGGQNRNKVETAVILEHLPTGLRAEASERRGQHENRLAALFRLRIGLALTVRTPVDLGPDALPSPLWRSRLNGSRLAVNPEHDDFPALLAEALDALFAREMDPGKAAAALGVSTSQLVKLLGLEPRSLAMLNDHRRAAGLHALR